MNKRNQASTKNPQSKLPHRRWPIYVAMLVLGILIVSGFFLAGQQHFSSMDYGMKNSRLRKQIDDLEAEKRRLILAREVSLSPAEIRRAAKKTGLADAAERPPEIAGVVPTTNQKASPAAVEPASMIQKTAAVSSSLSTSRMATALARTERPEKPAKKPVLAE